MASKVFFFCSGKMVQIQGETYLIKLKILIFNFSSKVFKNSNNLYKNRKEGMFKSERFILPRVAELLIFLRGNQGVFSGANKYTLLYIYIYILYKYIYRHINIYMYIQINFIHCV